MKYSILIPTRNGSPYILDAVKSVLMQEYGSVEVVVSINHSTDNTLDLLGQLEDSRLKIVSPPSLLPMALHYEWLLGQAKGEWVSIIGDDDGLMPYFFDSLDKIIKENQNCQAIVSEHAYYFWKGCEGTNGKILYYKSSPNCKKLNASWNLMLAIGGIRSYGNLPMVYTGSIVKNEVLKKIKRLSGGTFYHELHPDIYSGVAVSLIVPSFLKTEVPLFWIGTSLKSTGLALEKYHQGDESTNFINRANEFKKVDDHLALAKDVAGYSFLSTRSIGYIFSGLKKIPFERGFFGLRWVDYWMMTALKAMIMESEDIVFASKLEGIYKQQRQLLKIQPKIQAVFYLLHFFIKNVEKISKKLSKLVSKIQRRECQFLESYSRDEAETLIVASEKVLKLCARDC
jgi:glycosyltransferase involved in cell wall biosynthesis